MASLGTPFFERISYFSKEISLFFLGKIVTLEKWSSRTNSKKLRNDIYILYKTIAPFRNGFFLN
jgi:hypothetical protein